MKKKNKPAVQFAVCIDNEGYPASLEVGKLYRILPDEEAASHGYLRVIDETGEDYGYVADRFFPIKISSGLEKILLSALEKQGAAA
ncbi:MAG: hypothetical protein HY706_10200 [Candidatus Hydrogenedentes bacterium]|nr:hypothetical protein [Candidatus Hydrogenedentota bacterium]